MTEARLIDTHVPEQPEAVALVLHGGANRPGRPSVSPTQLSVLRMIPIANDLARAGRSRLAVFRLLNSVRGWDVEHTPADDARWALDHIAERLGGRLPTALVGHSLGGRAAIAAGHADHVRTVVALAPWLYDDDGSRGLPGRQVLFVHGSDDRIASPERSRTVARALSRDASVGYISIRGGKHAMLRHHRQFDGYATEFVTATLLGDHPRGPVAEVLGGQTFVQA